MTGLTRTSLAAGPLLLSRFPPSPHRLYLAGLPGRSTSPAWVRISGRENAMFDEMDRLRESRELYALLSHYAHLAEPDRQVWQDRLMRLDGCEGRPLTRVHGELLAFGWLEMELESPRACYRITPTGLKAWKLCRQQIEAA